MSKNLKVYKIQFYTELKTLQLKVKFPCKVKVTWKRSKQSVESSLINLQNGLADFQQKLKLDINMYYDTTTSKFVQKKCIYSFMIVTQKGQKSAGTITYDLAQFFNRRIYQIQQDFTLDKCPVPDTKMKMKIYYEESVQTGYDSMSQISAIQQKMDTSVSMMSEIDNLTETEPSEKSQKNEKSNEKQKDQQKYQILNQSAVDDGIIGQKNDMKDNITAVISVTQKINDFVSNISSSLKQQIQKLRYKNKQLQQSLNQKNMKIEQLSNTVKSTKQIQFQTQKQYTNYKEDKQHEVHSSKKRIQELQTKLEQSQKLCNQLENNLEQKGQSSSSYINELKSNFSNTEKQNKQQIQKLKEDLLNEKKHAKQIQLEKQKISKQLTEINEKYRVKCQKVEILQNQQEKRQKQLENTRIYLQRTYQKMVKTLGSIL